MAPERLQHLTCGQQSVYVESVGRNGGRSATSAVPENVVCNTGRTILYCDYYSIVSYADNTILGCRAAGVDASDLHIALLVESPGIAYNNCCAQLSISLEVICATK